LRISKHEGEIPIIFMLIRPSLGNYLQLPKPLEVVSELFWRMQERSESVVALDSAGTVMTANAVD
jgi:hypothetical protein